MEIASDRVGGLRPPSYEATLPSLLAPGRLPVTERTSSTMSPRKLLIDTNLWLDLASDYRLTPVLTAIEQLILADKIELLMPEIVLDEFARHRERVAEQRRRSLTSHIQCVRSAVEQFADADTKPDAMHQLNEIQKGVAIKGSISERTTQTVERVMATSPRVLANHSVKLRAVDRAMANLAPFHRSKNSMADALLIEIFAEISGDDSASEHYFVTQNTRDFSQHQGDQRLPHADFEHIFHPATSHYSTSLVDVVRSIDPKVLAEFEEEFNYYPELRGLSELLAAEQLLEQKVWYDRHSMLRSRVESGDIQIVPREQYDAEGYHRDAIVDHIWQGALAAAEATAKEIGKDQLGPWTDYEWGMVQGKLSALRWVLGDDWDMLDT